MYQKEPKCYDCQPLKLSAENEIPYQIYQQCRGQLIMAGMDGSPIDVSIPSVQAVMQMFGVADSPVVFGKVLSAVRNDIKNFQTKRESKNQLRAE